MRALSGSAAQIVARNDCAVHATGRVDPRGSETGLGTHLAEGFDIKCAAASAGWRWARLAGLDPHCTNRDWSNQRCVDTGVRRATQKVLLCSPHCTHGVRNLLLNIA